MAERRRSTRQLARITAKDPEVSPSILNSWTVVKLRQELKKRGYPTTGLKAELIARLESLDVIPINEMSEGSTNCKQQTSSANTGGARHRDKMNQGIQKDLNPLTPKI